jgi:hypothetical protein
MGATTAEPKKPLGVRVTAEQHRMITEAAKREHRSVNSYVLNAALKAASSQEFRPRHSQAEVDDVIKRVQDEFRKFNPTGRSIVDELSAERREAAKFE